jgi:iron(III) transport system substrate-binding protein
MKKLLRVVLLSLVALSLAACSSDKGNGGEESKELTLYSPHPAETINLIVEEFQKDTGIKVNVIAAGTGELLQRVKSESGNALGDVLWGGGAESLASFTDYFESYKSKELDNIDPMYYDSEYKWIGESPLPMVIMYNTNLVKEEDVPKSWKDLLKPEFKGKIAMADPSKSGSAYTIMATMIEAYGGDPAGWDFIKDFYANLDGKVLGSSSGVYKGVADGEYALGLTLEKEAIKFELAGSPTKIVYPSEGTSAIPDGVALIKGAKNEANAKRFIDYVLSKETQTIMSEQLSRRSIRKDAKAPEGLGPLSDITQVDYDFEWAASNKDVNLETWKNIVIGKE